MPYHYTILGAGRQGVALAYDLALNGEAGTIVLADADQKVALNAAGRLSRLLPDAKVNWRAKPCDVSDAGAVSHVIPGSDVVLSAVPYRFNVELTRLAIEAGASFCDLGGNTDVVRGSLAQHEAAAAAGVSVVPDCGLAPGLGNILAAYAIEQLTRDGCTDIDVHVRCGGLPETPTGPLQYKLVFNFDGLINEYSGDGEFLREGKPLNVPTLTEEESLSIDIPTGFDANGRPTGWQPRQFEAAVTSGGTSTCAA
jgi:lysine 6-dehydrogenase